MDNNNENMIEFISGQRYATLTFTNRKHINRIKQLYNDRAKEIPSFVENADGSVCARVPLKWIKINPGSLPGTRKGRQLSDEERTELVERLRKGRAKKNKGK